MAELPAFPFQAVSNLKFKSPPGSAPFALTKGEQVQVISSDEDGDWLEGINSAGQKGFFPANSVTPITKQEEEDTSATKATELAPTGTTGENSGEQASTENSAGSIVAPISPSAADSTVTPKEVISTASTTSSISKRAHAPTSPVSSTAETASNAPAPAAKPGSLRDRIAALNAQGAGVPNPSPPLPRAKPAAFKRTALPPPTSLPLPPTSPKPNSTRGLPENSANSAHETAADEIERGGTDKGKGLSAEDAMESIGKGGGSLKDRIKALQGIQLETPQAPGRAPRPMKKKSAEPTLEESEGTPYVPIESSGAEPREPLPKLDLGENSVVKDEKPAVEETTNESADAGVPNFAPATPTPTSPASTDMMSPHLSPLGVTAPSIPIAFDSQNSPTSATGPTEAAGEDAQGGEAEDDEASKRTAIAARMAGLGGQRVGMGMPALPTRAAKPRRKLPAVAPISPGVTQGEEEVVATQPAEEDAHANTLNTNPQPAEDQSSHKNEAVAAGSIAGIAGIIGAKGLLAKDEQEDEREVNDDDDDDFATPSLPAASSLNQEEDLPELAELTRENLDKADEMEPAEIHAPPPPPPTRPPVPPPTQALLEMPTEQVEEASMSQTEVSDAEQPEVRVTREFAETSSPVPTSPATASRPAIPAIPTSFVNPHTSVEKEPIKIPRRESSVDETSTILMNPVAQNPPVASTADTSSSITEETADTAGNKDEAVQEASAPAARPPVPRMAFIPPIMRAPGDLPPAPAPAAADTQENDEDDDDDEDAAESGSEEEEEEVDPEVARRAALAARMAKLGGMRMGAAGGMMMPPVLGPALTANKSKKKKKKVVPAEAEPASEAGAETEPAATATSPIEGNFSEVQTRSTGGIPTGGVRLPGLPPIAPRPIQAEDPQSEESRPESFDQNSAQDEDENISAPPPPLPAGRPNSSLPPKRSIPVPIAEPEAEFEPAETAYEEPQHTQQFVTEPEQEDYEESAPPPPPRPAGGLPAAPTQFSPPVSPISRSGSINRPISQTEASLERQSTRGSTSGSFVGGRNSIDVQRRDSLPVLAEQPSTVQTQTSAGTGYDSSSLQHLSSTLGAQVFAAAHTKLNERSGAKVTDENLIEFCWSRATNLRPPANFEYGIKIFELDGNTKTKSVKQLDEARAGDVVVFHECKFKHNLSTTKMGTTEKPRTAIVAGFDAKKNKLRTIEVNPKDAQLEESSHKLDDLKAGFVVIYRVVPQ